MRKPFLIVASALLIPAAARAQSIDDAQIAAIVVTANQVDISMPASWQAARHQTLT
jgi:hypothetical protein